SAPHPPPGPERVSAPKTCACQTSPRCRSPSGSPHSSERSRPVSTSQPNPVITAAMLEHDPVAASLPALLAQQAARIPSREFLRFGSDSFTFAEVDALTSQLAHWLLNAGILPGERVAIMLGNE